MRVRVWAQAPAPSDFDGLESRFPPGTRTGQGSESLRPFLEAGRRARAGVASTNAGAQRLDQARAKVRSILR